MGASALWLCERDQEPEEVFDGGQQGLRDCHLHSQPEVTASTPRNILNATPGSWEARAAGVVCIRLR